MFYTEYRLQFLAFFLQLFSAISTLCTVSACYKHVNIAAVAVVVVAAATVVVVVAAAAVAAFDFNNVSHFVAFVVQDKCQRQGEQSEKVTGTASSAEEWARSRVSRRRWRGVARKKGDRGNTTHWGCAIAWRKQRVRRREKNCCALRCGASTCRWFTRTHYAYAASAAQAVATL